jgi:hypothetical protein
MVAAFAAAVAEQGWTAAEVPQPVSAPDAGSVTRFDHDDPTSAPLAPPVAQPVAQPVVQPVVQPAQEESS